jgi:hypothetical protein
MGKQLRFIMDHNDEEAFVAQALQTGNVRFIDGPRWKSPKPVASLSISTFGWYVIIWSPDDLAELSAEYIPSCNDWYCQSEIATLQFLRSQYPGGDVVEGRIAVNVPSGEVCPFPGVRKRFATLSRFIKKTYVNNAIFWQYADEASNLEILQRRGGYQPDASLWIGPGAQAWLRADPNRHVFNNVGGRVIGKLNPPGFGVIQ